MGEHGTLHKIAGALRLYGDRPCVVIFEGITPAKVMLSFLNSLRPMSQTVLQQQVFLLLQPLNHQERYPS